MSFFVLNDLKQDFNILLTLFKENFLKANLDKCYLVLSAILRNPAQ